MILTNKEIEYLIILIDNDDDYSTDIVSDIFPPTDNNKYNDEEEKYIKKIEKFYEVWQTELKAKLEKL